MPQDFRVESRSYDHHLRGSWLAYRLSEGIHLGDEQESETAQGALRLWLPAGTLMEWVTGTRPLRNNCLQFFWPDRWYMLSAFYNEYTLIHTYANVILPPTLEQSHLSYVDLDLSALVKPDMSYEVLTQAEFEQMADLMHYSEDARIGALMALRALTSSIQRSIGLFAAVPQHLDLTALQLTGCN